MHLDPKCCEVRIDTDGSLVVVARQGRHVVAGSVSEHRTIDEARWLAISELDKAVRFAGER